MSAKGEHIAQAFGFTVFAADAVVVVNARGKQHCQLCFRENDDAWNRLYDSH